MSTAIFVAPIAASMGSAKALALLIPRPSSIVGLVFWLVAVLGGSTVVLFAGERLARRALPLTALLKMTLAFPDRAPTRLAVARRAGSTRGLERRLVEAQQKGIQDELSVAAEKILALAAALNVHDRRTRGHSERVRAYADLIAEQMKLPQADRDRLRWSALLHDVGKLTVHPDILNKAGKPSPEEWEALKRHPLEGAKITQALAGWLGPWANTIAEHHERFDGQGYPFGLVGTEISLGGRIVAVADSYEVMTAVRSYKSAMSPQAARKELAACAGSQFDPEVVRALLEVSLGRVRMVAGPLALLAQLPMLNGFTNLAQLGTIASRSVMTGFAAAGGVATGVAQPLSVPPAADLAVTHPASDVSLTSGPTAGRADPEPMSVPGPSGGFSTATTRPLPPTTTSTLPLAASQSAAPTSAGSPSKGPGSSSSGPSSGQPSSGGSGNSASHQPPTSGAGSGSGTASAPTSPPGRGNSSGGPPSQSPATGGSATGGSATGGPSSQPPANGGPTTGGPTTGGPATGGSTTGGATTGGPSAKPTVGGGSTSGGPSSPPPGK